MRESCILDVAIIEPLSRGVKMHLRHDNYFLLSTFFFYLIIFILKQMKKKYIKITNIFPLIVTSFIYFTLHRIFRYSFTYINMQSISQNFIL